MERITINKAGEPALQQGVINHENGNDANRLLAAAASWWNGLTVFKRELYIGNHYADDTPTNDKINTLYKMYNDKSGHQIFLYFFYIFLDYSKK